MTRDDIRPRGCADCSAVFDERKYLKHDPTCPAGRALDEVVAKDRRWFLRHPRAKTYVRAMTPAEVAEARMMGLFNEVPSGWEIVAEVEVEQVRPGFRVRHYRGGAYAIPPGGIPNGHR